MDGEQAQLSDEDSTIVTGDHSRRRRRRKKAIGLPTHSSMDQISVEFVLPAAARCKSGSDKLLLDVAANWTVEQVRGRRGLVVSDVFGVDRAVESCRQSHFPGEDSGVAEGRDPEHLP